MFLAVLSNFGLIAVTKDSLSYYVAAIQMLAEVWSLRCQTMPWVLLCTPEEATQVM